MASSVAMHTSARACACVCALKPHCLALPSDAAQAVFGRGVTIAAASSAWGPTRTRARPRPQDWTSSME